MKTVGFTIEKGNNNLDVVRIILAIMVIYGHGYFIVENGGGKELLNQLFPFTYSGALAVQVFFFISGMLVTNSLLKNNSGMDFLISRFFRVIPAFIFTIIVTTCIVAPLLTTVDLTSYFSNDLFWDYLKTNPLIDVSYRLPGLFENNHMKGVVNGSLWSIPFEIRAYLGLFALYLILGKRHLRLATYLSIFIILIPIFDLNKYTFINLNSKDMKLVISCFSLGVLYAINKNIIPVSINIPFGLFMLHLFINDPLTSQTIFFFSACTFALWFSSIECIKKIKLKRDISYGIYLWGFLIQQTVASYIGEYGVLKNQMVSIIFALIAGYVSNVVIERPCINLGDYIKGKINKSRYLTKEHNE